MSDMLSIARSGVLASRVALAVTAENVANVGTEGYRRRDVSSVSVAGGQTTPTTLPTGGQGVSVSDVRRAFDHLVAERARAATASQSATEAQLGVAKAIEAQVIPGEDGLDGTLRTFFDNMARLAATPADATTRMLALNSADAVGRDIAQVADGLSRLRNETLAQATLSAKEAQGLLADLHSLNGQIGQLGAIQTQGHHALADRRDALLGALAQHLPIAAELQADGRADVRLGSAAGPVLLDGSGPARLSVSAPDQMTLQITRPDGTTRDTRMITSARLGGLSMGIGAIDMAAAELDGLARNLVKDINLLHRGGVDLNGLPGRDLFRMDGWQARPETVGATRLQVSTQLDGPQTISTPIDLIYDGAAREWQAQDASGTVLARGQARLSLPGLSVDLAGPAQDGDRLTLLPVTGRAIDLRLVQADPSALAAATDLSAGVGPENSGSARLIATRNAAASATRSVDVHVTDATNRLVELRDPIDGTILASGALDQDGRATLGGLDLYLGAGALTGDWFAVRATTASSGNGEIAQAIADLRRDVTGNGAGLLDQITRLQGDLGIRAAAAQRADDTAQARLDAAKREESAIGAVDLDAEAARMVQLQQAYQASAQAMTIARSLFDTLMRMI